MSHETTDTEAGFEELRVWGRQSPLPVSGSPEDGWHAQGYRDCVREVVEPLQAERDKARQLRDEALEAEAAIKAERDALRKIVCNLAHDCLTDVEWRVLVENHPELEGLSPYA